MKPPHPGVPPGPTLRDDGAVSTLVATALWQRLDVPGLEHCRLWAGVGGSRLDGTILVMHEGVPLRIEYALACSAAWETTATTVALTAGGTTRRLELVTDDGRWYAGGRELDELRGCLDVDISLTPSTNTLPLRRLGLLDLSAGSAREVGAAWVRFPDLRVERLAQQYTRLDGRRFRYESAAGAFHTEIEVDDLGLVVAYPPFWKRVA